MITKFITSPFGEEEREKQASVIAEKYSWTWIAEETLKVYKTLLQLPEEHLHDARRCLNKKLKIVVIGSRGFPDVQGGIEKYCEEIYKRLVQKSDLEITAMVISRYYKNKIKDWNGVKFIYIKSFNSKHFEKIYYGLKAFILAIMNKPDIAHFHGLSCGIYMPLLKFFGIKIVVTFQSRDYLYPKWNKIAKIGWKISEKAVLMWSDKIIAVSKALKEYLDKYSDNVILIPNGVDVNHMDVSANEEEYYLQKYELRKKEYIFFAGRLTPEKSINDLINAFNILNEKKFKLVIAGDADYEDKYSRMVKGLARRSPGVVLTGFITGKELQVLFLNAKLFVLPSKFEGLPHVLLEAISYGVEILASNIEANLQINLNDENYFKQGDSMDLKRKMTYLLNSDLSKEEKSRRFKMLKNDYNWNEISLKIYKLYYEMV